MRKTDKVQFNCRISGDTVKRFKVEAAKILSLKEISVVVVAAMELWMKSDEETRSRSVREAILLDRGLSIPEPLSPNLRKKA